MNCHMCTASPQTQILLNSERRCTILRLTKQRSQWLSRAEVQRWDTCPELTGFALDWLFDRVNLDPKIQIKFVDTKNQLADMLTKGNFTRDERSHLLRLFNTMNFPMVSCSHFLLRSRTPCWRELRKEGQSLSASQSPTLDSGTSYSPVNDRMDWNSDLTSAEKSVRDRVENSSSSSQVWHKGDNPFPSTERSGREVNPRSSTGKREREAQNQLTEVKLNESPQFRDLQHLIHWESLHECQKKVESSWRRPDSAGSRSQCTAMEIICVNDNESSDSPWRKITRTTCSPTGTPTSMRWRRCSTSRRSRSWIRNTRFWMFPRLSGNLLTGWDLLCYLTK